MSHRSVPELLAPAGSLDAVRAAIANGADAVYLGAERFNARDEGAQLTLAELAEACHLAHSRGRRIYLTLNILVKPAELADCLRFLDEAVARGIDAVIVQDIGLVRLIQRLHPSLEIHGSTQMTVHDAAGAALMRDMGIQRVVLARENTIEDIRAIRSAVPELGLETFVHGALCISYSGQCYMSGMISERSANRGSCAQSCRKDYVLRDATNGAELDRGYLISAKDLAAHDHLRDIAEAGVGCLKVEGRKKKPEYVATVTQGYRTFLDRLARGEWVPATQEEVQPLVQIYSRGFTGGMYGGRAGRDYITRNQPDNYGLPLGTVVERHGNELVLELSQPVSAGDGLGFEPPPGGRGDSTGFVVSAVRTLQARGETVRQAIPTRTAVPVGWRVIRTSDAALLQRARASFAALDGSARTRRARLDVRLFGAAGTPLKALFTADGETVTVRSEVTLAPAAKRALSRDVVREQLGRLGETPFALAALDDAALAPGLFLPLSELNRLRQQAVEELLLRRDWAAQARSAERESCLEEAIGDLRLGDLRLGDLRLGDLRLGDLRLGDGTDGGNMRPFNLAVEVYSAADARAAANSGATEVVIDPFLRHPTPPLSRVRTLAAELNARGIVLRMRTPTIVRPEERPQLDRWLALELPILTGHLGLVAELAAAGRDVAADYGVNVFNQHSAAELFRLGARRVTLSVELTTQEMQEVSAPWSGKGFEVVLYGRPEGMTIEHCVLSAAFDREPTTCRDLCVRDHPVVELTDPTGYTFPVATDAACRNRLLHSRPVDGSEYLPRLWRGGLRSMRLLFNTPGDDVASITAAYRAALDDLAGGGRVETAGIRAAIGTAFTRGHFARAV